MFICHQSYFLHYFGSESIKVFLRVSFDNSLSQYHKIHFFCATVKSCKTLTICQRVFNVDGGSLNHSNFLRYLLISIWCSQFYQIAYLLQLNYHVTNYRTIRNSILLLTLTRLRDHSASKFTSSFVYMTQVYWSNLFEEIGSE